MSLQAHTPLLEDYQIHKDSIENVADDKVSTPICKPRYTNAPFIWFISASTILPLGIIITYFFVETEVPFDLAFVLGLITSIFGGCYFVPFITLKPLLIETYEANQKKRWHADKLRRDVKKMKLFRTELGSTKERMLEHTKQTKKFIKNLDSLNVDSLAQLDKQKSSARRVYKEYYQQLIRKEKSLLYTLYDRFEFQDGEEGMSKDEFNELLKHLPDGYEERIQRVGTFEKLSKGSGLISFDDFRSALDVFAEMELNDQDIDFEIEKQETQTDDTGKKAIVSAIVKKGKAVKDKWFNKST
eukprot:143021_1